ncbi:MAG: flagellar hook-associated protein FlgK [Chloroflexi bacterium]|nr:flagellar hook-associated protein FlgK [Chloroflexota bacterium]
MPTLSSISTSLQAVLTQSHVLEITQHNIANASTPGYRRQSAILTASVPSSYGGSEFVNGPGMRGGGVAIAKIQRFNLEFFDGRFRTVSAETKNWEAQSEILTQLEATLAETSEDGLLPKLDQFWAGWQSLSSDPTNVSLRGVLLDDASSLATAFNRRVEQINLLRGDQNLSIISQVDKVNSLADEVAKLNAEISHVLSIGEQPNDLMDKRDLALDQLSDLTGSVSYEQKNGEMVVSIGGHVLVVGHEAIKLTTKPKPSPDSTLVDVYWADNQVLIPPSGKLKGTLEVRDQILTGQLAGLNTLASGLMTQVNAIHTTGYGINNATGMNFFTGTVGNEAGTIAVNPLLDAASIATSRNINEVGNNGIALDMVALKSFKGMATNTATLNEYYNAQITDLAVTTQRAANNTYQHGLVAKALSDQRESVAGVSLDEEAANMAKAQKAYQAAARVLTTFDELLDLVINRMGLAGR